MGWRDNVLPASFRGVPFEVDGHSFEGGRRAVLSEYAGRDTPTTDDMGRRARKYAVRAYVIGEPGADDYFANRNALTWACESVPGPGLLVHPWLGVLLVQCDTIKFNEEASAGGSAVYDLVFLEAGLGAAPSVLVDTAGLILAGIGAMLGVIGAVSAIAAEIAAAPAILAPAAAAIIGAAVVAVNGILATIYPTQAGTVLPQGDAAAALANAVATAMATASAAPAALAAGAGQVTSTITGAAGDPVTVAVLDTFSTAALAVLALQTAAPDAQDAVGGQLITAQRQASDPSLGLATLAASFGATLPAPTGLRADLQAQLQTDLVNLVGAAATLAVAQIYANTTFTSSNAAANARTTLLALIDAQVMAAAAAQQDRLYQAWLALAGQAGADLLARIQQLPAMATYSFTSGLPACVIAQALYQDGTRATELQQMNDVPHPGFLRPQGVALAS